MEDEAGLGTAVLDCSLQENNNNNVVPGPLGFGQLISGGCVNYSSYTSNVSVQLQFIFVGDSAAPDRREAQLAFLSQDPEGDLNCVQGAPDFALQMNSR